MYWPLVGITSTLQQFMVAYREVFCRTEGFDHVSRYINGLLLSANKTLQGIYAQIVWPEGKQVSRRAMHESVFESDWSRETLMPRHRQNVAPHYRGRGRAVMSLDWTLSYHPYCEKIYGAKDAYDYVHRCNSCYQTVVTATVSNPQRVDGLAVEVQQPNYQKEELAYLQMTRQEDYDQMEQVRERLLELLHYRKHHLSYRKRTEMAVDIVKQIEAEGFYPQADYAFDQGGLNLPLTSLIEAFIKPWLTSVRRTRKS
jgi:SRSO17 transposase